jgi:hypothetical protein
MPSVKRKAAVAQRVMAGMQEDPPHHAGRPAFTGKPLAKSQLPTFEKGDVYLTAIGANDRKRKVIELTCARRDCRKTFIVPVKDYWPAGGHGSGACPFCFKASWRGPKPVAS